MEFFDFFEISHFFKCNRSKTILVFHDLKNVKIAEKSLKIGQFLPILAHFSQIYEFKSSFFFKLVEQAPATYLKFDIF
jgi:hypothetical protein